MNIASTIDHTELTPDTEPNDIDRLSEEARRAQFAAICIPPYFVNYAKKQLADREVLIAGVAGFPMGYDSTSSKVESLKKCANDGADEVDVVANICAIKSGDWKHVEYDLKSMVAAAHSRSIVIKIIIEASLLTDGEVERICALCAEAEPNFVKTSTGKNGSGATVSMVRTLRELLPEGIKIKASGGIRSAEQAENLLLAGASRLGTSRGLDLVKS